MAGEDLCVIGQVEQPFDDVCAKLLVVAARQVGAPDAAAEERVASEDPAFDFGIEADAADGMARCADDLEGALPYFDDFAVLKITVGQVKTAVCRKSKPGSLLLGMSVVVFHIGMRRHRDAVTLLDRTVADDMVDMAMGADDHQRLEAMAVDETEEFVFLGHIGAAWIDEDAVCGIVVINDIGVFREGIKDKLFEFEHDYNFDAALRRAQGPLEHVFFGAKVGIFPQYSKEFAYLCPLIWYSCCRKNDTRFSCCFSWP